MSNVSMINGHIEEPKKETNYDIIKQMNKRELIGFLYSFLLPWVGGEKDENIKKELWDKLDAFLSKEVADNGNKRDKTEP